MYLYIYIYNISIFICTRSVQYPISDLEEMFSPEDGPKARLHSFSTFYRANVAELLHAERVCHLLTEVCFGDPGLGFQPSDFDPDMTARVLLRGVSWPRLLSGYEEIEPAPGWKPFGVMKRKRAPFRWELLRAEHFPHLSWWYSRLVAVWRLPIVQLLRKHKNVELAHIKRSGFPSYRSETLKILMVFTETT